MLNVMDKSKQNVIKSCYRPGGNFYVTATTINTIQSGRIKIIKELKPNIPTKLKFITTAELKEFINACPF